MDLLSRIIAAYCSCTFMWVYFLNCRSSAQTVSTTASYTVCGNYSCYDGHTTLCDTDNVTKAKFCRCAEGFQGETCTEDRDECAIGHPCINRGRCINTPGSFSCDCLTGWIGGHCENGTGDPDLRECMPGWALPRCTSDLDECKDSSLYTCGTNQHCENSYASYKCVCDAGWQGLDCKTDIDECFTSTPCEHGGICKNSPGSYNCACVTGWTGHDCTDDIDECLNTPCQNSGTCTNTNGSYSCGCVNGYQGINCEVDVNECLSNPCKQHGKCVNSPGSFSCDCYNGWNGTMCDADIDECILEPCENNGTCTNTKGSFSCHCAQNWTGLTCDTDPATLAAQAGNSPDDDDKNIGVIVGPVIACIVIVAGIVIAFIVYRQFTLNRVSQDSNSEVENLDINKKGNIHKTGVFINPTPPADTNALPKT